MSKKDKNAVAGWAWLIPIIVIIIGIGWWKGKTTKPAASYPIVADAQDIWVEAGELVKVKISPDCWSGWVNLPPGAKFTYRAPGDLEFLFLNGQRILSKDKGTLQLRKIPSYSFRLRGAVGEATIFVHIAQNPVSYY